jgi:hypothetical protein
MHYERRWVTSSICLACRYACRSASSSWIRASACVNCADEAIDSSDNDDDIAFGDCGFDRLSDSPRGENSAGQGSVDDIEEVGANVFLTYHERMRLGFRLTRMNRSVDYEVVMIA